MTEPYEAAAREASGKPHTFAFQGETFTCHLSVDGIAIIELAMAGREQLAADDPEGNEATLDALAAMYEFLQAALPAGEWRRFRRLCRRKRVPADEIIGLASKLIGPLTGRPTTPSSPSAGSPEVSGPSSTNGSAWPAATVPIT